MRMRQINETDNGACVTIIIHCESHELIPQSLVNIPLLVNGVVIALKALELYILHAPPNHIIKSNPGDFKTRTFEDNI